MGLVLVSWLFLGLGNETGRIVLVAHVLLVEVLKTQLDSNETSRSVLILVSCLPHLDHSWEVDLLQFRELVGQQAGNQKCFADEVPKGLDGNEFVVLQHVSADVQVLFN